VKLARSSRNIVVLVMPRALSRRTSRPRRAQARRDVQLIPLLGLPEVEPGDDLGAFLCRAAKRGKLAFRNGDILVVAQKIVSKAEGAVASLSAISPSPKAIKLAATLHKDARFLEVVLQQSRRIVREDHVLIVETHHGFICANAGVDHSNVPGVEMVTLLPADPDRSAGGLAQALHKLTGKRVAVIVSDTFGRPWRLGLTNVAIGAAGLPVLLDLRGGNDRTGKPLQATILAVADELAAAAGLVMGKAEGIPAVLIRGYRFDPAANERASSIIRPAGEDLFR
jgi:coenzyme F420-0:L-glutamate ligase/coenzyme F420-1:gamma-L-glutamate ligase